MRRGLIDQQQAGLRLQCHARQCQPHRLTARQAATALAQRGTGVGLGDGVQRRPLHRGLHLGSGLAAAQRHIALHRAGKDVRFLAHPGHALAQGAGAVWRQCYAVQSDLSRRRCDQASQQTQQRALAGTAGTDQRHMLASGDIEVVIFKNGLFTGIGKLQAAHRDGNRRSRERCRQRRHHQRPRQRRAFPAQLGQCLQRRLTGSAVMPSSG